MERDGWERVGITYIEGWEHKGGRKVSWSTVSRVGR